MLRRVILLTALVLVGVAAAPGFATSAGRSAHYGPYPSDSPDSGTCGNTWANDVMDRVYKVDTVPDADGIYTVVEEFKRGTFTTVAGQSPGACQDAPRPTGNGNTVPDGLTGKMHGSFVIVVTGGTYDPDATCEAPCYTTTFVANVFGASATLTTPIFSFHYSAGNNGHWKNASLDRGGNSGDITG